MHKEYSEVYISQDKHSRPHKIKNTYQEYAQPHYRPYMWLGLWLGPYTLTWDWGLGLGHGNYFGGIFLILG